METAHTAAALPLPGGKVTTAAAAAPSSGRRRRLAYSDAHRPQSSPPAPNPAQERPRRAVASPSWQNPGQERPRRDLQAPAGKTPGKSARTTKQIARRSEGDNNPLRRIAAPWVQRSPLSTLPAA